VTTGPRFLPAKERIARPWKNGGGVTRDIAVFPEGPGDTAFLWRTSVAAIAAPGPFSSFPGIDRAFLLLDGELAITVGGADTRRIDADATPLVFGGEQPVHAEPGRGGCVALNVMTRRGRVSAKLDRWSAARPTSADALLVVSPASAAITCGDTVFDLAAGDALLLDHPAGLSAIEGAVIAIKLFYAAG